MITDMLDLSKIEAGKMSVIIEPFQIKALISEVLQQFSLPASEKGLQLTTRISSGLSRVKADRKKLYQILLNLVDNAIKFTERGEVKVECTREPTGIKVTVADTGIGISCDNLQKLFQPFDRLGHHRKQRYEGTALGLYLSQKLARLMGGDLTAHSELDKGSCFTLTLPSDPPGDEAL